MPNCLAYGGCTARPKKLSLTNIMLGFTLVRSGCTHPDQPWRIGLLALDLQCDWGRGLALTTLVGPNSTNYTGVNVTIGRVNVDLGLWKGQEVCWVFAMQFFMLIGLFGFIPHMSIWLTTNYGLSASTIGLFYMQGGIGSLIGNQVAGWLLQRGLRFSLIGIGSVLMGTVLMLPTQISYWGRGWVSCFWHHAWRVDADAWPANYPD